MPVFGNQPLGQSKASPASFHTLPGPMKGGGQSRNTPASSLNVGQMAATAQKVVRDTASGAVKGVKMMGSMGKAFGKAMTGQDDFTRQVGSQAKGRY